VNEVLNAAENIRHDFEGLRAVYVENLEFPSKWGTQVNVRETYQDPDRAGRGLFSRSEIIDMLPRNTDIEFNAAGQVDPDGRYTAMLLDLAEENPDINFGFHAGASMALARPTIEMLTQRNTDGRNLSNIIFKLYARLGKFEPDNLRGLLDEGMTVLPPKNIRVCLEHIFSISYNALTNPNADQTEFENAMQVYTNILQILKERGIKRISMPDTRGAGENPSEVFAVTGALLNEARQVLGEDFTVEFHFHNDNGKANQNARVALQATGYLNTSFSAGIIPVVDTAEGGERNGITRPDFLDPSNDDKYSDRNNLNKHTAGTHADYIFTDARNIFSSRYPVHHIECIPDLINACKIEGIDVMALIIEASQLSYSESTREEEDAIPEFVIGTGIEARRLDMLHLLFNGIEPIEENKVNVFQYLSEHYKLNLNVNIDNFTLAQLIEIMIREFKNNQVSEALLRDSEQNAA
jgi:hypothetical protein